MNDAYFLDFVESGSTLVMVFPPFGQARGSAVQNSPAWGASFITRRGYSLLGFKPAQPDWFRCRELHQFLRSPRFIEFLQSFERVVLYGGSMGGYAALSFSALVPNAEVLALSPQSTLDPRLVPWETRWVEAGQRRDWNGDFADAARHCASAARAVVTYDPRFELDRKHVERLPDNVMRIPVPNVGHSTIMWLNRMGALPELFRRFMAGELDRRSLIELVREKSRQLPHYYVTLAHRLKSEHARELIGRAEKLLGTSLHDFSEVATAYLKEGLSRSAEAVFLDRAAMFAESADFHFRGSKLFVATGDTAKATEFARKAVELHPTARVYRIWLDKLTGEDTAGSGDQPKIESEAR
ncbi:tetratricopeptide repeat protein [Zavarzinia sp.]|uniref:tetratricopeptide repeat protein n=1 Tax=Zavarzinia sp. TaxID=2027920 RepID=UPI003568F30D